MIKIGILGDIGSGKTFISNLFGYPVFSADKEIVKIYKNNKNCFFKLNKKFPNFINKFPVNKNDIISLILKNKKNIEKIGKIVHPYVHKELKSFLKKNKKKIVILDIPLLLENKITMPGLIYIFIDTKKKDIAKNLLKRPKFDKKLYNIMKENQLPLSYKKRKSRFIIKNNFINKNFLKEIKEIKKQII
tara:strand:- start:3860 stop:4426 length:567 start_codon:yes stop_codon:yes gene_type:complete